MNAKHLLLALLVGTAAISTLLIDFPQTTQEAYGQSATTLTSGVSITISDGTGGGGPGVKNPATVTFSGFAYPEAVITYLRNGTVVGTSLARIDGTYTNTVSIDPGLITFGVFARDDGELTSATANITLNVKANSHIDISNIFLSPTITADRFKLQRGGTLRIFGSAFPESLVRLFNNLSSNNNPIAEINTGVGGAWEYFFPTEDLGEGGYSLKVNAQIANPFMVSPFSENLEFTIAELVCSGADFNFDTRVNIIDFSILIFYWQKNPAIGDITNICTDLNTDEIVNIFDFSILMHQWTN